MSEVRIPFGENTKDQAVLLLSAAEELDQDASVVRTAEGAFVVPKEVADKAGLSPEEDSDDQPEQEPEQQADDEPEPKKSARKSNK